ncbi:MAG TPA: nucleotidyltransferase family protein [Acidimicrobiia bacterium]|jgi:molybdenum cofactor cytidylyltransferase|nr:nucleotidyltransferase family protein [Acidimicrobiia bacterium]
MPIAAVILAAGGSRRLGRPKQLEPWGDTNLLGHVVARTSEFPVEEVWVVVGYEADRILAETDLGTAGVVENPEWEEGIASSIRVGLDALTRLSRCDQALIVIGDQPAVPVEVVDALLASHAGSDKPVSVPKYRYTSGNPVLVDRLLWPRLMSLEGDEGAGRLWQAHPEWVNEVWFSDLAPRDVDTETDVAEMRPKHPS